jgi:hypothetical protein
VIQINIIAKHLLYNEISLIEVRRRQGFYPTQRTARAAKNPRRPLLLRTVPVISTTRIGDTTHRSSNLPHLLIKMSLPNSQESSQMDLYDQESYSIPEDELRSISTAHSSDDDDNIMGTQVHFDPSLSDSDLPNLRG